ILSASNIKFSVRHTRFFFSNDGVDEKDKLNLTSYHKKIQLSGFYQQYFHLVIDDLKNTSFSAYFKPNSMCTADSIMIADIAGKFQNDSTIAAQIVANGIGIMLGFKNIKTSTDNINILKTTVVFVDLEINNHAL
ncbi:hypothetical protein MXB_1872, partial [Myxobolus squamalis]